MSQMFKKYFAVVLFVFISITAAAHAGEVVPRSEGWVNDYANVINDEYRLKLESLITELEQKTSAEIAVVTVKSIAPHDEISYARLILDNWKIGKKGKDNGVLVLLAIKERRWRIETGYGEEGILPDGKCGEIGRDFMVPFFKQGKYSEGLYSGVTAVAAIISRDSKVTLNALSGVDIDFNRKKIDSTALHALLALGVLIFLIAISLLRRRHPLLWIQLFGSGWTTTSGGWRGGGGGGGFGGGGFGGGGGGGGGAGGGF